MTNTASLQMGARRAPVPTPADHVRLICRCHRKGCKFVQAIDVPTITKDVFYSWLAADGWHREKSHTVSKIDETAKYQALWEVVCPEHGRDHIGSQRVKGTFSEARKCDARCTGAIGHSCDCQCGGANHGCDHL